MNEINDSCIYLRLVFVVIRLDFDADTPVGRPVGVLACGTAIAGHPAVATLEAVLVGIRRVATTVEACALHGPVISDAARLVFCPIVALAPHGTVARHIAAATDETVPRLVIGCIATAEASARPAPIHCININGDIMVGMGHTVWCGHREA